MCMQVRVCMRVCVMAPSGLMSTEAPVVRDFCPRVRHRAGNTGAELRTVSTTQASVCPLLPVAGRGRVLRSRQDRIGNSVRRDTRMRGAERDRAESEGGASCARAVGTAQQGCTAQGLGAFQKNLQEQGFWSVSGWGGGVLQITASRPPVPSISHRTRSNCPGQSRDAGLGGPHHWPPHPAHLLAPSWPAGKDH